MALARTLKTTSYVMWVVAALALFAVAAILALTTGDVWDAVVHSVLAVLVFLLAVGAATVAATLFMAQKGVRRLQRWT